MTDTANMHNTHIMLAMKTRLWRRASQSYMHSTGTATVCPYTAVHMEAREMKVDTGSDSTQRCSSPHTPISLLYNQIIMDFMDTSKKNNKGNTL